MFCSFLLRVSEGLSHTEQPSDAISWKSHRASAKSKVYEDHTGQLSSPGHPGLEKMTSLCG